MTIYCENGVKDINEIRFMATRSFPQYNQVGDMMPFLKHACSTILYEEHERRKINEFLDRNFNKDKSTITISRINFTLFSPTKFMRYIRITTS